MKQRLNCSVKLAFRFERGIEADSLLAEGGCEVQADSVVRMPPQVVRRVLATCARNTRLWNREGTCAIDIDGSHTWFLPGMTYIKIYDLETGEPRDSAREDLAMIAKIADGLSNIDSMCGLKRRAALRHFR